MAPDTCIKSQLHYVITQPMEAEPIGSKLMEVDSTECCINGQKTFPAPVLRAQGGSRKWQRTHRHSFNACYFSIFELMYLQWCFSLLWSSSLRGQGFFIFNNIIIWVVLLFLLMSFAFSDFGQLLCFSPPSWYKTHLWVVSTPYLVALITAHSHFFVQDANY